MSSVVFLHAGFEVTGIDYSPGMIEVAKLDGHEGNPHHRVDYCALFLRKLSSC